MKNKNSGVDHVERPVEQSSSVSIFHVSKEDLTSHVPACMKQGMHRIDRQEDI